MIISRGAGAGPWAATRSSTPKLYGFADVDLRTGSVTIRKTSAMGKTELLLSELGDTILPGTAPSPEPLAESVSAWAVGRELPEVWPGRSAEITATAALPPLAQVERLVEMFGASGDAAPSFAAALIGELVLTRMRLQAADPRTLWGLEA